MQREITSADGKAQQIELLRFDTPPMRAFHLSWVAFCVAFFAWFAAAPLTPIVRDQLGLSAADLSNAMIASVAATIFARIVVGFLCDRFGPPPCVRAPPGSKLATRVPARSRRQRRCLRRWPIRRGHRRGSVCGHPVPYEPHVCAARAWRRQCA
ncbi:MAG: hypothetical protein N3C12_11430, partial [Candidatus Binatia bacterium]|nr:hypothetical protein [Candidatus Binatia bacterium]